MIGGKKDETVHDHGSGSASDTLPSGMETTVKLDAGGTPLTAVVFGDVDYAVDSRVFFSFHKNAVLFDRESGKNIAKGRLA